ncbi:MAG TPA: PaaI family thioesterase [Steroidobacteraceae bacterium]|nr:PaaI family thioesterase [Steroidobacteraceae bacterium]
MPTGAGVSRAHRRCAVRGNIARHRAIAAAGETYVGQDDGYVYGLVPKSVAAAMTGRELLQAVVDARLPQPPIAQTLSFHLAEVGDGFAAFEGDPAPHLLNPWGAVHGGWALTLIDSAAACAAQTTLPAGVGCTTIETKGNFSRPITVDTGRLRAEARVVAKGRQIISCEAWVRARDGRILAHGTATLMAIEG